MPQKKSFSSWCDRYFGILALMPALIMLGFIVVYPAVTSITWSFTNRFLIRDTWKFIGLDNFMHLLTDDEVYVALWNGVRFTVMTLIFQLIVGMVTALLLNRISKGKNLFRLLLMVPWTFPVIVTVMVWSWILQDSGILSQSLFHMGLIKTPVAFLAQKITAMKSIIGIHTWDGYPLMMMSILAGLQSIPKEYYEVAQIEGAKGFQTFWRITLPSLKPILQVILVLRCAWTFNNFNLIFLLTGGGPGVSTENLPIIAYKYGWSSNLVGRSSAVSVIMLLFLTVAFFAYIKLFNSKGKGEGNVF